MMYIFFENILIVVAIICALLLLLYKYDKYKKWILIVFVTLFISFILLCLNVDSIGNQIFINYLQNLTLLVLGVALVLFCLELRKAKVDEQNKDASVNMFAIQRVGASILAVQQDVIKLCYVKNITLQKNDGVAALENDNEISAALNAPELFFKTYFYTTLSDNSIDNFVYDDASFMECFFININALQSEITFVNTYNVSDVPDDLLSLLQKLEAEMLALQADLLDKLPEETFTYSKYTKSKKNTDFTPFLTALYDGYMYVRQKGAANLQQQEADGTEVEHFLKETPEDLSNKRKAAKYIRRISQRYLEGK